MSYILGSGGTSDGNDITRIGTTNSNLTTGGTENNVTLSLVGQPYLNGIVLSGIGTSSRANVFSATTFSATTIFSGSASLDTIFIKTGGIVPTYIQAGSNTSTGGTASNPIINVVDSPSFNGITLSGTARAVTFSATTLSASTLYSGTTELGSLFAPAGSVGGSSTYVNQGSNITTGGTASNPIINVVAQPYLNGIVLSGIGLSSRANVFSATTLSATTLYSGSTELGSLFAPAGSVGGSSTYVNQGSNITTGGTASNPIINVSDSPSFNNITISGSGSATIFSATTIYSGATSLSSMIFAPYNFSIANQTFESGSTKVVSGSTISIPASSLKVGSMVLYRVALAKDNNNGTLSNTFVFRMASGSITTGSTSLCSFATGTGTAVLDAGFVDIMITIRAIGATAVAQGQMRMTHNLSSTGLANKAGVVVASTSGTFDSDTANLNFGLTLQTATATALSISQCRTETKYIY